VERRADRWHHRDVFDLDDFLARCQEANTADEPRRAIREVLDRALAEATSMGDVLAPAEGGITLLHHADDLTVLHAVWAPGMRLYPHNHEMWAAIGIYAGQEDNAFYRRAAPGDVHLTGSGGKQLRAGDTVLLGDDTIHSVTNPLRSLTAAIHVYGGDFVNQPRSQWGPGPEVERPYDYELTRQQFAEANAAWRASS
jgi:predicted metal-dependent enzyme (double-stranded beta helix superfamily)